MLQDHFPSAPDEKAPVGRPARPSVPITLLWMGQGSRSLVRDPVESFTLLWSVESRGRVHLQGGDQDLIVEFDPELSYFFDHEPSWIGHPVNR